MSISSMSSHMHSITIPIPIPIPIPFSLSIGQLTISIPCPWSWCRYCYRCRCPCLPIGHLCWAIRWNVLYTGTYDDPYVHPMLYEYLDVDHYHVDVIISSTILISIPICFHQMILCILCSSLYAPSFLASLLASYLHPSSHLPSILPTFHYRCPWCELTLTDLDLGTTMLNHLDLDAYWCNIDIDAYTDTDLDAIPMICNYLMLLPRCHTRSHPITIMVLICFTRVVVAATGYALSTFGLHGCSCCLWLLLHWVLSGNTWVASSNSACPLGYRWATLCYHLSMMSLLSLMSMTMSMYYYQPTYLLLLYLLLRYRSCHLDDPVYTSLNHRCTYSTPTWCHSLYRSLT